MQNDSQVNWSPDLTTLADALLEHLKRSGSDPFGKHCIVVNSVATEKWLKQYFLLVRKTQRLLFNLEFVMLPEFVNDWVWAVARERSPRERRASRHPYSRDVLTWRIYRKLAEAKRGDGLDELLSYVEADAGADDAGRAVRRSALAEKLAVLYDDYLNCRFDMLRKWENEKAPARDDDAPKWQSRLYGMLVAEDRNTYVSEYECALREPDGSRKAIDRGFPDYLGVHIFDVPFIPEPTLKVLEKISKTLPLDFWVFNPKDDWLADTPSQGEVKRKLREKIRKMLESPEAAADPAPHDVTDELSPEERLLGVMASGARGVIAALCGDFDGDVAVPGYSGCGESPDEFRVKEAAISVHRVFSPRRELEAVKNGLLHFFNEHPEAAPHDALVLCADWETYAPIIDMVFPPTPGDGAGYVPVATESAAGISPVVSSFEELLNFRSGRFGISSVFSLLNVPEIRAGHGLDEDGVAVLRDMVKKANIHWGIDAEAAALEIAPADAASGAWRPDFRFTWQRGLDRLTAELLHGFDTENVMKEIGGEVGRLHPCGKVEGESRTGSVASLWSFVEDLKKLRFEMLPPGGISDVEKIRGALLWVLETFYREENSGSRAVFASIRRAVAETAENMRLAGIEKVENEVFVKAVTEALNRRVPGRRNYADAVLFAPLNVYTATPRKFVWICGLNDSVFPRLDRRASYDVIGVSRRFFDVSLREQDAFALLKAVLCVPRGGRLALSFVGKDVRTNQELPPSVLLKNLTDYFAARGVKFDFYDHPLAGYSRRCFVGNGGVPRSYSAADLEVAKKLAVRGVPPKNGLDVFPASDGTVEISLDDLASFFAKPNEYLFKRRLKADVPWLDRLDDNESLAVKLDKALKWKLALASTPPGEAEKELFSELQAETGSAPDPESALKEINNFDGVGLSVPGCLDEATLQPLTLAEAYRRFTETPGLDKTIELEFGATKVRLTLNYRTVDLLGANGEQPYSFLLMDYLEYASNKNEVLIRHLAVNAASPEGVTTMAAAPTGAPVICGPVMPRDARDRLIELLRLVLEEGLPAGYPDLLKAGRLQSGGNRNWNDVEREDALPKEWQENLNEQFKEIRVKCRSKRKAVLS